MLTGDLAEPDGPVQLHRCQPWTLRIGFREHERDPMRPRNLDRSVGSELLHPGIPGILRGHERVDDADALRCGDVQPQLIIQLLHGLPRHPSGELLPGWVHRVRLNAHRGPGRTRRASPAASMPTLDTTHRVSGTRTRPNAPSELGPISRVRALAPRHPRDTTWTRTGRRRRRHVVWGHTIPIPALAIRRIASKRAWLLR